MFNAALTGLGCRLGPENMLMSYCFFDCCYSVFLNGLSVETKLFYRTFSVFLLLFHGNKWISIKSKMETHQKHLDVWGDIFVWKFFKISSKFSAQKRGWKPRNFVVDIRVRLAPLSNWAKNPHSLPQWSVQPTPANSAERETWKAASIRHPINGYLVNFRPITGLGLNSQSTWTGVLHQKTSK